MPRKLICLLLLTGFLATPAFAYVGPGSGLGIVGVVFGVIGTLLLSLVSLVWYPLKRLFRKLRAVKAGGREDGA